MPQRRMELDPETVELCLQACWLHHAENERLEVSVRELSERPFLEILRWAVNALA